MSRARRDRPFINDTGRIPGLEFRNGRPYIKADKYGAAQLLAAVANGADADGVADELNRILRERDALPLVSGLIFHGWTFATTIAGERAPALLNHPALKYAVDENATGQDGEARA